MSSNKINCKKVFQKAFENRYTWPDNFTGYQGRCVFEENNEIYNGDFILGKNFQPQISNLDQNEVIKKISSQLFEVSIHRVKKTFDEIHSQNNFHFLRQSEKGIEMQVSGKNDGDRYRVKDKKINMVYRKIHGVIIEIFVEDFFDTGNGVLSQIYSSQQLDQKSLIPKTQKYNYQDKFIKIENTKLWALESRIIKFQKMDGDEIINKYLFKDIKIA